jgi:hypothetical protein
LPVPDLADGLEHLLHPRALRHHLIEPASRVALGQLLAQVLVLAEQPLALLRLAQDQHHLVGLERLGDVVVGAALHRLERHVERAERRHHDHRRAQPALADLVDQRQPVELRHPDVREHHVVGAASQLRERLLRRAHRGRLVALAREQHHQHVAQPLFVVDDEHLARCGARCLRGQGIESSSIIG